MKIPRKIFVLFGLLVVLLGGAVWFFYKGKPTLVQNRLLDRVEESAFNKISIQDPPQTIVLEKKSGEWFLSGPLEDAADAEKVDDFIGTMKSFSIGTIISEKKERYSTFGVEEGTATRIQMFVQNSEKPALDIFVGKQAISYGTTYLRMADQASVYIANNLPSWSVLKSADEFRQHSVLPMDKDQINSLVMVAGSKKLSLSKTTDTWVRDGHVVVTDTESVKNLLERLTSWKTYTYLSSSDGSVKTGLDKPALMVTASTGGAVITVTVGNKKTVPQGSPDPMLRYAQRSGRTAIFFINAPWLDDAIRRMETLSR